MASFHNQFSWFCLCHLILPTIIKLWRPFNAFRCVIWIGQSVFDLPGSYLTTKFSVSIHIPFRSGLASQYSRIYVLVCSSCVDVFGLRTKYYFRNTVVIHTIPNIGSWINFKLLLCENRSQRLVLWKKPWPLASSFFITFGNPINFLS